MDGATIQEIGNAEQEWIIKPDTDPEEIGFKFRVGQMKSKLNEIVTIEREVDHLSMYPYQSFSII